MRLRNDYLRPLMPLATLIALVAIVGWVTPEFLTTQTLLVLASDTATLFTLATGVTFVIMLGGIVYRSSRWPRSPAWWSPSACRVSAISASCWRPWPAPPPACCRASPTSS
ncbi:MAG: hypothetical protein U1F68_17035 [Gammaproteobacteria bacterium]